jgi:hypothetical protein
VIDAPRLALPQRPLTELIVPTVGLETGIACRSVLLRLLRAATYEQKRNYEGDRTHAQEHASCVLKSALKLFSPGAQK